MKTKILYVLVSRDSDYYSEQMLISLFSLRCHNPEAWVTLLADNETLKHIASFHNPLFDNIDEKVAISFDNNKSLKERSRELKTNARNYFDGDFLFLDTDTLVLDNLDDIDKLGVDIGGVYDLHQPKLADIRYLDSIKRWAKKIQWSNMDMNKPYYNSGVMYVRDNVRTREIYRKWNEVWKVCYKMGVFQDQPALNLLNQGEPFITKIDDIWHCQILGNGLRFLPKAKIIHYFNGSMMKQNSVQPYYFMNTDILKSIRKEGINKELEEMIIKARGAFPKNVDIISGYSIFVYNSSVFRMLLMLYNKTPNFFNLVDKSCEYLRRIIFFKKQ